MKPGRPVRSWCIAAGLALVVLLILQAGPASGVVAADGGYVSLYRAQEATFDDAAAVEAAIANGTVEPPGGMLVGETLVVAVRSDRLAESMAVGNGSTTRRFLDAVDGEATFYFEQTNPTVERPAKVASVGSANATALRSGSTVYVLVDTGALAFRYGEDGEPTPVRDGDRFTAIFGYDGDERATEPPEFALYGERAEFFDHRRNEPLAPEVVNRTVVVNIEPDDSVVARLALEDDRTLVAPVEPVTWSGFQGVTFDLRDVEPGTDFTLELVHDGSVVERYRGTVAEPRARVTNATLTRVETDLLVTKDGERVTETIADHTAISATARLSHGGKLVVLDGSCEQVGVQWLDPGNETSVSIPLWRGGEPVRARNASSFGVLVRAVRAEPTTETLYRGPSASTVAGSDADACRPTVATSTADPGDHTPPTGSPAGTSSTPPDRSSTTGGGRTSTADLAVGETSTTTALGQPGFTAMAALLAIVATLLCVGVGRE